MTYNLTGSRRGVRSRESRANAGEGVGEEEYGKEPQHDQSVWIAERHVEDDAGDYR